MTNELTPHLPPASGSQRLDGPEALLTAEWSIADLPWIPDAPEPVRGDQEKSGTGMPTPPSQRRPRATEFVAGSIAPLGPPGTRAPLITHPRPPLGNVNRGPSIHVRGDELAATLPPRAEREVATARDVAPLPLARGRKSFVVLAAAASCALGYPMWTVLLHPTAADAAPPPTVPEFMRAPAAGKPTASAATVPVAPSDPPPRSTLPPELADTLARAVPSSPSPQPTALAVDAAAMTGAPPPVISQPEAPPAQDVAAPTPEPKAVLEATRRRADALRDALEAQRGPSEPEPTVPGTPAARRRLQAEPTPAPPARIVAPRRARPRGDAVQPLTTFTYDAKALFAIATAPMRATDLVLERGESLLSQPTAGDAARWVINVLPGADRTHVFVKPLRSGLRTNLTLTTDRRSYFLELTSREDGSYMAGVEWQYPADEAARRRERLEQAAREQQSTTAIDDVKALCFDYRIKVVEGAPSWKPTMVFDDGKKTFVRFARPMADAAKPVLLIPRTGRVRDAKYVNYRIKDDLYVIDRLIDAAELRLGRGDDGQDVVRIERQR